MIKLDRTISAGIDTNPNLRALCCVGRWRGKPWPRGGYIANLDEPPGGADYEFVSFRLRPQRTDSSWRLAGMWGLFPLERPRGVVLGNQPCLAVPADHEG